jgi:uncharacterized protein (DUF1330 family)
MSAYALAHLKEIGPHPEILEYLERIQSTLDPFAGRFIVHGGTIDVREGTWPGNLVIIEFPTMAHAREWYDSLAYRAILPFRTRHIEANTVLVEGVEPDHDSAEMAAQLRAAGWGQASPHGNVEMQQSCGP